MLSEAWWQKFEVADYFWIRQEQREINFDIYHLFFFFFFSFYNLGPQPRAHLLRVFLETALQMHPRLFPWCSLPSYQWRLTFTLLVSRSPGHVAYSPIHDREGPYAPAWYLGSHGLRYLVSLISLKTLCRSFLHLGFLGTSSPSTQEHWWPLWCHPDYASFVPGALAPEH